MPNHLKSKIVRYFVQGLLAVLPLTITFLILRMVFSFLYGVVDGAVIFLPHHLQDVSLVVWFTQLAAFLLLLAGIIGLGILLPTVFGKMILRWMDGVMEAIPLLGAVYRGTKQLIELVTGEEREQMMGRPVYIEYPQPGTWAIAFDTGRIQNMPFEEGDNSYHTIFVPTTPNPTTGWLFMMPESKIRPCQMGADEAMKFLLTGGVVKPSQHAVRRKVSEVVVAQDPDSGGASPQIQNV